MSKTLLRIHYKSVRENIGDGTKHLNDTLIFNHFINSSFCRDFELFLCYVSVGHEVDTLKLLDYLLKSNKRVSVPYCNGKTMSFYEINSLDELISGKFGIPTVDKDKNKIITDFSNALCIVPALSFDNNGNRLGYGGGYYDRFLADNEIKTLGLSYECCIADELPSEEYDIKIQSVLTEKGFRYI